MSKSVISAAVLNQSTRKKKQFDEEGQNDAFAMSDERNYLAIMASNKAIWDYDLTTDRVYLSEAWSTFLGGEKKPTLTTIQELAALVPEEDRQLVRATILEVVKGSGFSQYQVTHRVNKPDGGFIWVLSEGKVIERDQDGNALRMIGINHDVTERKQLENELHMRDARYRAVIEASADGFWMIDIHGQLREINDVYVRLSGYSREELLAMRIDELEARMRPEETADSIARVMRDGHCRFETLHRRKNGSIWPVEIVMNYWPGIWDRLFVSVIDISERKELEREVLEQRNEMEGLVKRQVAVHTAAAIAHELNQPLLALVSYSEAALMMLKAENPDIDKICKAIEASEKQALRAGQSMRELIDYLSLNEFPSETFDLNREILDVLGTARTEHELAFHTELQLEEGLPLVQANRTHVKKVLFNLLHNSIEAMQEAGVPLPSVTVTVRTNKEESFAQVTMLDNGPGIKAEDIRRLFEPFFTTKKTGIGMGLAISRSLIEANGGQLWVDPHEGPGAVFHLTLPLAS